MGSRCWLVLVCALSCNFSWALQCVGVRNQLQRKGFNLAAVAADHADSEEAVCASPNKCCSADVEAALLQWAQRDLSVAVLSATQPLDQLLETTLADASERMTALLDRSAEDTRMLMRQVYPSLAAQPDAQQAIAQLYLSLGKYSLTPSDSDLRIKHLRVDVRETIARFFADLFSPAFLCVIMEPCRAVTVNYSICLVNNAAEFEPFGDEPKRLAKLLANFIGEYRAAVATFRALQEQIAEIRTLGRRHNERCVRNVARLKLCPICSTSSDQTGFCPDYCQDTLQSCLHTEEWREKWDSALRSLKNLELMGGAAATNEAEQALADFGKNVQLAVTNVVETRAPAVAKSVVERCGSLAHAEQKPLKQLPPPSKTSWRNLPASLKTDRVIESLEAGIRNLSNYIGWWPRVTANLCRSADDKERCWNGTAIGKYVKASLPTAASPTAAPTTSAYPDHETMVARMTKINEILEEARSGGKSRPGRRYGTETMLLRPEEEGTGEGLLQGDYNSHHPWGVDDEDMMDGSGSGVAPEHADAAEYADIGAPVWPDESSKHKQTPAKEKPLYTTSDTHPEDLKPAAKSASQRGWCWTLVLFVFAFVRW